MKNELEGLREKIDKVDSDLISLLKIRLDLVMRVGKLKKKNNLKPLDNKRWNQVLERITEKGEKQGISKSLLKKIWNLIHEEALKIEDKV